MYEILMDADSRNALFLKLKTYGLKLDWLHVPFTGLAPLYHAKPAARQKTIDAVRQLISVTSDQGIPTVVMHPVSFPITQEQFNFADTSALVIEGMQQLVTCATEYGTTFSVENQDNLKREPYARAILDAIPEIKLCYDTGHGHLTGTLSSYLPKYIDRLVAVHFHDNSGQRDNHALPGDGTINWKDVRTRMESYKGIYGLETQSPKFLEWDGPLESFFKEAYRRLQKAVTGTL